MGTKKLEEHIRENWEKSARLCREDQGDNWGLPYPYYVPSIEGGFNNLYYWDSFFTAQGMLVHGKEELVKSTVDDMLYLVDKIGYMPNGNAGGLSGRSQPPFLSEMVRQLYEIYKDPVWLRSAYEVLKKEYHFWMTKRLLSCGLNRYGFEVTPENVSLGLAVSGRLSGLDFSGMSDEKIAENVMADAESGWDFSPRCELHLSECAYVDLNSILYRFEKNMEYFAGILAKKEETEKQKEQEDAKAASPTKEEASLKSAEEIPEQTQWKEAAKKRLERMQTYLYNGEAFFDYNEVTKTHSPIFSAASFYPLWAGVATKEQAECTVKNLYRLEYDCGISTCEKGERKTPYQWDYPNAWAPLQYMVVHGLDRYGYKEEARRLAGKYVGTLEKIYEETGTLWEKYNVTDGSLNVTNEYEMPEMLGWTAGVYIDFLEYLK